LVFFDEAVEAGDLVGSGPGKSADNRLKALRKMIVIAGQLIDNGDVDGACGKLQAIYKKIDGLDKPQDFADGESLSELQKQVQLVMESIECK